MYESRVDDHGVCLFRYIFSVHIGKAEKINLMWILILLCELLKTRGYPAHCGVATAMRSPPEHLFMFPVCTSVPEMAAAVEQGWLPHYKTCVVSLDEDVDVIDEYPFVTGTVTPCVFIEIYS